MVSNCRLRVGFVSIEDASDMTSWSGIPYQILSHLRQLSVDVEVFSPLDRRLKLLLAPHILLAKARNRRIVLNLTPLLLRSYARQIERLMVLKPVDVIISANATPIAYLNCSQPVLFWSDIVFHDIIGYYPGYFSSLTTTTISNGKKQEERALSRCDAAVYSSEWAANSARALTDPKKIHVLPFGSSLQIADTLEETAARARRKRATRGGRCELLFVGVDWERKGGDMAVETARLLNEAGISTTLSIVGSQPKTPPPAFVKLLGTISKSTAEGMARLAELYRNADIFILPTKAEASAIVFCEAACFGVPIVTYNTGGVGDYVRENITGVALSPGSPATEFASTIRQLLQPGHYEQLAERSWKEYAERLNWRTSVRSLLSIASSLVGKG